MDRIFTTEVTLNVTIPDMATDDWRSYAELAVAAGNVSDTEVLNVPERCAWAIAEAIVTAYVHGSDQAQREARRYVMPEAYLYNAPREKLPIGQ